MRGFSILVVLAVTSGCAKKSAAHPAFESFVNGFYGRGDTATKFAIDGIKMTTSNTPPDEVEEGLVVFPVNNVGHLDWLKTKLVEDSPAADGNKVLRENVDICFAVDELGGCNRPNSYEFRALMMPGPEGGAWFVAGVTHRETNSAR